MLNKYKKFIFAGILGMVAIMVFYWLTLFVATRDFYHPFQQFLEYKYWITPMILGFGIQTGLFWYIRSGMHLKDSASNTAIATGAGSSGVAMVACCAHHLVDLLPILGLSAAAMFLSEYITYFFLFGIISNLAGIVLMIYIVKNKKCFSLSLLIKNEKMKNFIIIFLFGVIIIFGGMMMFKENDKQSDSNSLATIKSPLNSNTIKEVKSKYEAKSESLASVTAEVTPTNLDISNENNIFTVSLNTHSVDMSNNFVETIKLEDDLGNTYNAIEWTGNTGGHHISGDIIFGKINNEAKSIKIILEKIGGVDRIFEWTL